MVQTQNPNGLVRLDVVCLSGILLLGLALRLMALLSLKETVYFDFLLWDERVYHTWAVKIANGTYDSLSVYEFSPLPAYIMAGIYKAFSPNPLYIRILNIAFGVATCYLLFLIGKGMANWRVGLFSCLIGALYKPFIFFSVVLLKTSLSLFLFGFVIYLFVDAMNSRSRITMGFLGVMIGLLINVRPNCVILLPFIPILILFSLSEGKISAGSVIGFSMAYVLGVCVAVSPFLIRNYRVSGEASMAASNSGYNLYLANNPENPIPYYRPVRFATSSPFEMGIQFTIEASRRTGTKLTPRQASDYWTRQVVNTMLEAPEAFTEKIFLKFLVLFNEFEAADNHHIGFLGRFAPFFSYPFLGFALVLPLGMAGMAFGVLRSRKLGFLGAVFFLYCLTLVVFFTNVRLRAPLLIILIPFSVLGIDWLVSLPRPRRARVVMLYCGIAIALLVIEFLPVIGTDDMTAYYNTHAIVLNSLGQEEEAMRYWEKSSEMQKPYSAFANLSLAGIHLRKENFLKARHYLEKIPEKSFGAAAKYNLVGDMMIREKHVAEAILAYEKSLEINAGQRKTRLKLLKIFEKVDPKRASEERLKLEYISSFYDIL